MTARHFLSVLFGLLVFSASQAVEQDPANWKTECVGRMQIRLPGEVDVAAMMPKDFIRKLKGYGNIPFKFVDGQEASWSSLAFGGLLELTHASNLEEQSAINGAIEQRWQRGKADADEKSRETGKAYELIELPRAKFTQKAWKSPVYYRSYLLIDGVALWWTIDAQPENMPRVAKTYASLLEGLRPRPLFDVPHEPGVCLPYLFIRDDGSQPRGVGTTYRLKDHPDITVWLEDGSAALVDPRRRPETYTPQYMASFFWEQDYQNRRSFKSLWPGHKAFKEGTLAGRKGVKTFVELTRYDAQQTKDYGYLVAVRGDPDARDDAPDLMLYVIQDSVNATKRGVPPLGKDEFFRLAETIAASVRHRPAQMP